MKFALIEMKLALVKLLLNFEILPSNDSKMEYLDGIVRTPKNGVNVILRKRVK